MNVPFELHIALRYLLAKRKQAFISVISLISTLGVTVGVMAVVIALAMMTGLQNELRDRMLGSNPHIYVWKTKGIADDRAEVGEAPRVPHVIGAAPAILGQGLISAAQRNAAGPDQRHRSGARAAGHRIEARSLQRQPGRARRTATDEPRRHSARQGSRREARRRGRRLGVAADAEARCRRWA